MFYRRKALFLNATVFSDDSDTFNLIQFFLLHVISESFLHHTLPLWLKPPSTEPNCKNSFLLNYSSSALILTGGNLQVSSPLEATYLCRNILFILNQEKANLLKCDRNFY